MTAPTVCLHCNTPTPDGVPYGPYCCVGCRAAHALVSAAGLDGFYRLRGNTRLSAVGDRSATPHPERLWLTQTFQQAEQRAGGSALVPLRMDVQGLECAACVWLLEKLYLRHPGAASIEINPAIGRIELSYRRNDSGSATQGQAAVEQFVAEAESLGYRTGPAQKASDAPLDDLVLRLGLCAAMAMNSMIFAFSQYFGLSKATDASLYRLFAIGGFVLATATVLIGGTVFFRSAWLALRRRILHMDVPIALGILLTYAGSAWSFFAVEGRSAYFDTLCIFITLMLLGRLLQRRLASHNRQRLLHDDTVEGLLVRTVTETASSDGSKHHQLALLPAANLQQGNVLLCAPGELLPVQAQLLDPSGEFSLDWIMGESTPVRYQLHDTIAAGAHNRGEAAVRLRTLEPFSASRLRDLLCSSALDNPLPGELSAQANSLQESSSPSARPTDFWDHLSRYYVASVLTLAALAFALWTRAGVLRATEVAVAVLVVTCPCALGIATPLAYELAQARLRRRGLFVRTPSFFDRALRLKKILLDKTGTVTLSKLVLSSDSMLTELATESREALFHMVARSNHPVSRALLSALPHHPAWEEAAAVRERAGEGLELRRHEHTYRLGRPRFALTQATDLEHLEGGSQVVLSCDGLLVARFSLREELCQDASAEVQSLRESGYQLHILSGDRREKVEQIAKELAISDAHAELTPEQKHALVEQLDGGAHDTLMIGDGINDALAFSAAACAGTPAIDRPTLPARADFYFAGVGIGPISETLRTAHYLRRVIVRNMGLAALYNSVVLGLSFAGLMTPLRCALAMPISSLLMIAVTVYSFREPGEGAQRLRRSTPERPAQTSRPGGSPAPLALAEGVSS